MNWSVFKADSFLGFCSIRKGVFLIALSQLAVGVCIFFVIDYLRPSLLTLSYAILLFFTIACSLGIISAAKKSVFLTLIYLCVSIIGIALQGMIVAELSEAVHFLPKPENNITPLVQPKDSPMVIDKENPHDINKIIDKKNDNEVIHALGLKNHKLGNKRKNLLISNSKFKPLNSVSFLANSFYDSLPFVPHLGETEGESEEVSQDELPPEAQELTKDERSEVIALYKIQKRPIKLISAAFFTVVLLFHIYSLWIVFTFFVNKCTNLDELKNQPEQFTPIVEGIL